MRVALIHYWLVNMRGGEKVLEALCELFPDADIYTHVYDKAAVSQKISSHKIYTTSVAKLPFAKTMYQKYLAFMPKALEQIDLSAYDLVISSESGPAKGVLANVKTRHICYCHTPMRYLWDFYHQYMRMADPVTRLFFKNAAHSLRLWDIATANRVDSFVANSANVAQRIKKIYRRESSVIYPPVEIDKFKPAENKAGYFLFFGQLTGYKRLDIAIEAFKQNGRRLVIAGAGRLPKGLPANIEAAGRIGEQEKAALLSGARALIFPGEEDFGMIPVEAIASGAPVLAYGQGGALETVKEGVTGLFFKEQSAESLNKCLKEFESREHLFDKRLMRMEAMKFDKSVFLRKMGALARAELKPRDIRF